VIWLRRIVQILFLVLFLHLFLGTMLHGEGEPRGPVAFFFNIDPLILVSAFLASGTILTGSLLALVTVAVTLLLGRFFCGWVCPLGTLHDAVSVFRRKLPAGMWHRAVWSPRQRGKYYILIGVLTAALMGVQLAGILDPISFLVRSTTTVVFPALVVVCDTTFDFLYNQDPAGISAVSEPVYSFLRDHVLPYERPAYAGAVLLGLLFLAALAINLWRPRFWCRYLCPLGAMLGLCSRTTAFKLKNDPSLCTGCNLCAYNCRIAADPHIPGGWHNDECVFCWKCKEVCPTHAIRFRFEWPSLRPPRPAKGNGKPAGQDETR